ncbi:hypothetical protein [Xylocopilactobacillus apis]|uniref:Surface layer protein A domain-containing protein n=1 Tax=Xylocopilactobacillus apis TaxID=2932183 RepID=A0AAU9CNL4_9LACO|nr:hypothetical protein [Xylocopilactobacillus apis]BDR55529.1 hypothetical protein KIMC2_00910 [Xylocopilactobacillus apis]
MKIKKIGIGLVAISLLSVVGVVQPNIQNVKAADTSVTDPAIESCEGVVCDITNKSVYSYDAPNGKKAESLVYWEVHKVTYKTTVSGNIWYQLTNGKWVNGKEFLFSPTTSMAPLKGEVQTSDLTEGVRVYSKPDETAPTAKYLKKNTYWKIFGIQNNYYNVGKDQWIPVLATSIYPAESFRSRGYVKGKPYYGVDVYNDPRGDVSREVTLWNTMDVIFTHKAVIDGEIWYQIEKTDYGFFDSASDNNRFRNKWVKGEDISFQPIIEARSERTKINYHPGYGVRVYKTPSFAQPTKQLLKHGTIWHVSGYSNGFFKLGKNQWVPGWYLQRVK